MSIVLSAIWRGLAERRWSQEELARLQTDLTGIDLLADDLRAVRAERANLLAVFARLSAWKGRPPLVSGYYPSSSMNHWIDLARKIPWGWVNQNIAFLTRIEQRYLMEAVNPQAHRIFPEKALTIEKQVADSNVIYGQFARATDAQIGSLALIVSRTQTGIDQAVTACALERFSLDHGVYPAALSELVPAYLERVPTDLIDGAPLRYGPMSDGRYRLYSVGWNGCDDGGQVVWDEYGRSMDGLGDWPWQYEPFQPPPSAQRNK